MNDPPLALRGSPPAIGRCGYATRTEPCGPTGRSRADRLVGPVLLGVIGVVVAACGFEHQDAWEYYAADPQSTRYAALDQIDARNFEDLEIAWTWESADLLWKQDMGLRDPEDDLGFVYSGATNISDFQLTPIVVDDVLYGITSADHAFALDPGTGQQLWVRDLESYRSARNAWDFVWPKQRGVTYWSGRILIATHDAYLVSLDARTGEMIDSFGEDGRVDLMKGLRGPPIRRLTDYFQSSPVVVHGDTVIVGGSVSDLPKRRRSTPGDIRGYDARTGEHKWTFHVIPEQGEPGIETWKNGSWNRAGGANAWGPMSVDPTRGLVYAVTSTPTGDFYGGNRPGDNLYAESLLCLDVETGELVWHYQLIRHGLWDYDPSASPILVDIVVDERRVEAVAQATKQGFLFVFDRVTGEPVWPIADRPVPISDIPGERSAQTQPFPTRPPPFERQGTHLQDLADFTPEIREQALQVFRRYRSGPLFLPPSFEGSLVLPGSSGGTSWRGAAVDLETGWIYIPSITQPSILTLEGGNRHFRYVGGSRVYGLDGLNFNGKNLPLFKPPYSRITAIDLNSGDLEWQVPNGEGPRDHPLLRDLDLPRLGSGAPTGIFVTPTLAITTDGYERWIPGLGKPILRAYDKRSGEVVGEVDVEAPVRGVPMTYMHDGKQYIAMTVAEPNDGRPRLIALALPD